MDSEHKMAVIIVIIVALFCFGWIVMDYTTTRYMADRGLCFQNTPFQNTNPHTQWQQCKP